MFHQTQYKFYFITIIVIMSVFTQVTAQTQINVDNAVRFIGKVTENGKVPVTNATVFVTQSGTLKAKAITDSDGNYSITMPIDTGLYSVIAKEKGYKEIISTGTHIEQNQLTTIDFNLDLGTCTLNWNEMTICPMSTTYTDSYNPNKTVISSNDIEVVHSK